MLTAKRREIQYWLLVTEYGGKYQLQMAQPSFKCRNKLERICNFSALSIRNGQR